MPDGSFSTVLGTHGDPAVLDAKLARLHESHIAPVTELIDEMKAVTGLDAPYVDPDSGGAHTSVLALGASDRRDPPGSAELQQPGDAKRKVHAAFIEAQRLCIRQASTPGSVAHA